MNVKRRKAVVLVKVGVWILCMGSAVPLRSAASGPQRLLRVSDPIEIRADRLEFFRLQHVAIYMGDVTARQKEYVLRCQRLDVIWNRQTERIEKVVAREDVVLQTQRGTATSGLAVLDIADQTITLTDSPRLVHGEESVEGGTIIYSIAQKKSTVLSDEGQRVRSRVLPKGTDGER